MWHCFIVNSIISNMTSTSAHSDGTCTMVPHTKSTIMLYTELHTECHQQISRQLQTVRARHVCRRPLAIRYFQHQTTRRRCLIASPVAGVLWWNFLSWEFQSPKRSTLIFGDALISLKRSEGNLYVKNSAQSMQPFWYNTRVWQTHDNS